MADTLATTTAPRGTTSLVRVTCAGTGEGVRYLQFDYANRERRTCGTEPPAPECRSLLLLPGEEIVEIWGTAEASPPRLCSLAFFTSKERVFGVFGNDSLGAAFALHPTPRGAVLVSAVCTPTPDGRFIATLDPKWGFTSSPIITPAGTFRRNVVAAISGNIASAQANLRKVADYVANNENISDEMYAEIHKLMTEVKSCLDSLKANRTMQSNAFLCDDVVRVFNSYQALFHILALSPSDAAYVPSSAQKIPDPKGRSSQGSSAGSSGAGSFLRLRFGRKAAAAVPAQPQIRRPCIGSILQLGEVFSPIPFFIQTKHRPFLALEVENHSTEEHARIVARPFRGTDDQKWVFTPTGTIRYRNSGLVISAGVPNIIVNEIVQQETSMSPESDISDGEVLRTSSSSLVSIISKLPSVGSASPVVKEEVEEEEEEEEIERGTEVIQLGEIDNNVRQKWYFNPSTWTLHVGQGGNMLCLQLGPSIDDTDARMIIVNTKSGEYAQNWVLRR